MTPTVSQGSARNGSSKRIACTVLVIAVGLGTRLPQWFSQARLNVAVVSTVQGLVGARPRLLTLGQTLLSNYPAISPDHMLSCVAAAEPDPDNMVHNGSFEFLSHGWSTDSNATVTQEVSRSGGCALAIRFPSPYHEYHNTFQELAITPGHCYSLEAFIRAERLVEGVGIDVWDAERGYGYWYGGKTAPLQILPDWTRVEHQFCVPNDVRKIQLRLRCFREGEDEVAWFDDIRLETSIPPRALP